LSKKDKIMETDGRRKIMAGARLRKLRAELALSQSAMAQELGVSISYLNLMERNQRPVTAQVLIKLSETYAVDPKSFAQSEELRSAVELEEVFTDALFQSNPVSRNDIRMLTEQAPGLADAVRKLHGAYTQLLHVQSARAHSHGDSERGDGPATASTEDAIERVRRFLQQTNNHFPQLEARADSISAGFADNTTNLFTAICDRLQSHHNIRVQVMPVSVMGKTLRRFDVHRKKVLISELMEPSGRTFQAAYHLALLEAQDEITTIMSSIEEKSEQVERLARVSLANYFAAALIMPYHQFLNAADAVAYDVEILCARFSASFEQVAHRLTTLSQPSAKGVPFFMIRVDNAGNVSKRFSSGAFPFSRLGGTCPRWNIHSTFHNPGRVETQVIEMPEGAQWFSIARTVRRFATPWGEPDAQFVVGLGCEMKYASKLVYGAGQGAKSQSAIPIGINCRLCERPSCAQRAAPAFLRPLEIHENIRGYSPFDTELTR
jgi:XRE family transcriptional regulator, fatty acid utilization regulator